MLEVKNLKKNYKLGKQEVPALKNINLVFRKNEFVSILGPSGCGKTTLLNMIGGLDQYNEGDILINGKSTKKFKNKDWDNYRNKKIGFIFQAYNLIPHQTILENVTLTLTIAGVKKKDRVQKAKDALDKVGLKDLYHKKPNQLSGGQCQRVAIARAIVNEPEILLADEPTGALDSKTSIQVMEIIKEISKDHLVIMVTHNPELAEQYSTRIINLKDGEVEGDTDPYILENPIEEKWENVKKSKMGYATATKLSFKSLMTKKGRTALTCLAGSIGIIGVGLVLATSKGVNEYIYSHQDAILYNNPIQASEKSINYNSLYEYLTPSQKRDLISGKITVSSLLEEIRMSASSSQRVIVENKITKDYVTYLEDINNHKEREKDKDDVAQIYTNYGIDLDSNIFTEYKITDSEKEDLSLLGIKSDLMYTTSIEDPDFKMAGISTELGAKDLFRKGVKEELAKEHSKLIAGKYPTKPNELLLNIGEDGMARDVYLARLGLYTKQQLIDIMYARQENLKYYFDYSEILGKKYYYYSNNEIYTKQLDKFTLSQTKPKSIGFEMEIVGICETEVDVTIPILVNDGPISGYTRSAGLLYTEGFEQIARQDAYKSEIVQYGLEQAKKQKYGEWKYNNIDTKYIWHTYNKVSNTFQRIETEKQPYERRLADVGAKELPQTISIIATSYKAKANICKYLDKWNQEEEITVNGKVLDNSNKVFYNDPSSFILDTVQSVTDVVSIALVVFTSLSLVVSSVMISVITYISVMERRKEIGTIRAIGGRKADVSKLFNAETFMLGLISGIVGIIITEIASVIINVIVGGMVGIPRITNFTPITMIEMIILSTLLTLVSGLIPSFQASKKDPAEALRSI